MSHSFAADVVADTGGAAFSEGPAIESVTATVCTLQGFGQDCLSTTVGPRVIPFTSRS